MSYNREAEVKTAAQEERERMKIHFEMKETSHWNQRADSGGEMRAGDESGR